MLQEFKWSRLLNAPYYLILLYYNIVIKIIVIFIK